MKILNSSSMFLNRIKILIYGLSGNGKTYLSGTIREPIIIISAEAGLLSISGSSIDVIDITTDDNGNLLPASDRIERLKDAYRFLCTDEAKAKYKWIFLDSLTEISQTLVEALQKEYPDRKDSLVLYGENSKRMRALIKAFRDLPWYNVVMTALAEDEKDEQNRRVKGISMVGKIGQQLPSYFDEVFYLHAYENEDGQTIRRLITKPNEKLVAKDRSGKCNLTELPDLQVIANKIRGIEL